MCAGEREMNDEKNQRFTEKNIIHLERQYLYIFFQWNRCYWKFG